MDGERKSVEPMAEKVSPARVAAKHQSLLHFVGQSAWSDEAMLAKVRELVAPALAAHGGVEAWIVDDTGFPKKGSHSVGVARQYCGRLGKTDNCQIAVSLSIANHQMSLPIAYRLYLPEAWANDRERRAMAHVPEDVQFRTKPQIALAQIEAALRAGVAPGVVLADAAYGSDGAFRARLTALRLTYAVGVLSTLSVWPPGVEPLPPERRSRRGRKPTRLQRDDDRGDEPAGHSGTQSAQQRHGMARCRRGGETVGDHERDVRGWPGRPREQPDATGLIEPASGIRSAQVVLATARRTVHFQAGETRCSELFH